MKAIGSKAMVGLSLLCALFFSAVAAEAAAAAAAQNTTAFTCVEVAPGTGAFADSHCDQISKEGKYSHSAVSTGVSIEVSLTNAKTANKTTESTPAVLKGTLAGVALEIECKTAKGEGSFSNQEPSAKVHTGSGTASTNMSECQVKKPAKCTVKEPISLNLEGAPVEKLGAGGNEMGGEVKPDGGGEVFITLQLVNKGEEKCPLANVSFEVKGSGIVATGGTATQTEKQTGSTAVYTNAMTKERLSIGGKAAEFSLITTVSAKASGIPLGGTTVT
jgi:hypothetical protein